MTTKMTTKEIMRYYLRSKLGKVINNHTIEQEAPLVGKSYYGKLHSGGTYARVFREMKSAKDIKVTELQNNSKETQWRVDYVK
jgi:hypothetical protein